MFSSNGQILFSDVNLSNSTKYSNIVLPNCFVGSTQFISSLGVITLRKGYEFTQQHKKFDVPTSDGDWSLATVKKFGVQRIFKIVLERSTYFCTSSHRWLISTRRGLKSIPTVELKHYMKIPYRMCNTESFTHVIHIEDTGRYEGVYCVVEPRTKSFTLSGGELTGNCETDSSEFQNLPVFMYNV